MARPKVNHVTLSDDELKDLKKRLKSKDTNDTICNRCRILIALDENHPPVKTYKQCMDDFAVSRGTVANTVKAYADGGVKNALTIKRNPASDNARRKVDGRTEARIIKVACGPVPEGHSRWTIRLLEDQMKIELDEPISREAIRRTLKKTGFDLTAANIGASPPKQTRSS